MIQRLTFKDGTKCESSRAMESAYGLYIYLGNGISIDDAIGILADNKKMEQVKYTCNKVTLKFNGYTRIISIHDEGNAITAMMGKVGAA